MRRAALLLLATLVPGAALAVDCDWRCIAERARTMDGPPPVPFEPAGGYTPTQSERYRSRTAAVGGDRPAGAALVGARRVFTAARAVP